MRLMARALAEGMPGLVLFALIMWVALSLSHQ